MPDGLQLGFAPHFLFWFMSRREHAQHESTEFSVQQPLRTACSHYIPAYCREALSCYDLFICLSVPFHNGAF